MKPNDVFRLKTTLHKSQYVSESIDEYLKERLRNFLRINGCLFNVYELLLNGAILSERYVERFLLDGILYNDNGRLKFGDEIWMNALKRDIERIVDILCGAGYVPTLKNGHAPKNIIACKTIHFNHNAPEYKCIHINIMRDEDIGDVNVFGFNTMKSTLDKLEIQYNEFCGYHIIFDDTKTTPFVDVYATYCEYLRVNVLVQLPDPPTEATFAEEFTKFTGVFQIDGYYGLKLRIFGVRSY